MDCIDDIWDDFEAMMTNNTTPVIEARISVDGKF